MFSNRHKKMQHVHDTWTEDRCTQLSIEDVLMNTFLSANRINVAINTIKKSLRARKTGYLMNELIVLGVELEMIYEDLEEIRRAHHL